DRNVTGVQTCALPILKIVAEGARAAAKTLQNQSMEVLFRTVESVDAAQEIAYLDELLAAGVQGLAIAPVDDARVCRKLDEIAGQIGRASCREGVAGAG